MLLFFVPCLTRKSQTKRSRSLCGKKKRCDTVSYLARYKFLSVCIFRGQCTFEFIYLLEDNFSESFVNSQEIAKVSSCLFFFFFVFKWSTYVVFVLQSVFYILLHLATTSARSKIDLVCFKSNTWPTLLLSSQSETTQRTQKWISRVY